MTAADSDSHERTARAAALPIALGRAFGLLHPAPGKVGVLLCSAWGYEELCVRKTWRRLADAIADAGYPCLRFDYPGTADALGVTGGADSLESWTAAVAEAAQTLVDRAGVETVVLGGQGLGAALAFKAAGRIPQARGLAALAPVVRGRAYVRELAAWSAMIAEANGVAPDTTSQPDIAGFVMPAGVAADLHQLDLTKGPAGPLSHALVLARPGRAADERLAEHLRATDTEVAVQPYEGLDALLTDPTTAVTPVGAIAAVTGWLQACFPQEAHGRVQAGASTATLSGQGFAEEMFRFGPEGSMLAVFCRPDTPKPGAPAAMLLNGGYDYHIGWARMAVDHARALAASGVASLRIDAANVGDSPARPGHPEQVLYSDVQVDDVRAALDELQARGYGRVLVAGRCSGAYLGLLSAVADPRVCDLVMVNALRFAWDPAESVDDAIRTRSFGHYRAKALQLDTLKRILAGQVDVSGVAGRLAKQGLKSAAASLSGLFGRNPADDLQAEALRRFTVLRDRGVAVSLAYSDSETEGVERLARVFGKDGAGLAAFPNTAVSMIEGADHNLTPKAARDWLLDHIRDRALGRRRDQASAAA